jgi:long-chain acyl-CoA synthetase
MYDLLREIGARRGDAPAIEFGEDRLNYRELLLAIDRAADLLLAQGVGKGTAIAILSENRPEVMIAYYAAARLGGVFVPINPVLTAREAAHIVAHSGAKLLIHDQVMNEIARQAAPESLLRPLRILREPTKAESAAATADAVDPAADFLIIYTSGSTGAPKAVLFDQRAEIAGNASLIEMWGITEADVTLVALPLGFLYGLSTAAATGLQAGGRVVIQRRFHPGEVLDAMVAHRVTLYHGVPTMFTMMLDYAEQNDLHLDLSFMRMLICAGAPLSIELKARFKARFGKAIDDYYALTEVRPVFGRFSGDKATVPEGAIGRAAPGAIIRVVDGSGAQVADGVQGELAVRAPATLGRYFKDEALTRSVLLGDLFRTGDLGYRDSRGFYYLTGRIKDIIIRGGANVAPAEIEAVIITHPGVQSAAIVGVPDRKYGEVPVAFVIRRGGVDVSAEALTELCRQGLAEYKVPSAFHFVSEFPLGPTGKVDKNALKAKWVTAQG